MEHFSESTPQPVLREELRDCTLWLQLNRPHALNALTQPLVDALIDALNRADESRDVRAIVLHGAGRGFCAGTDLRESEARARVPGANEAYIRSLYRLADVIECCTRPVVAAVHGAAVAGGLELALACDFIVASQSARLGDGHANYAMFPGGGATVRLPRRVGAAQARRLMFTGDLMTAQAARAIGLVDDVVPDDGLHAAVEALLARITAKSPLVIARLKEALRDGAGMPVDVALRRERDLNALHATSLDRAEGLAAFREKRPPRFTGR